MDCPRICGCSWVRPHYIYRQLCRISTVLLLDYSQSQSHAEVTTARRDTTKPHTSLRQVKHPVLVLIPVHASVRPPYFTRQQMCLLEQASGTCTHCGRVCSIWQNPLTVHIATGCFIIAECRPSSGSYSCCVATAPPPALQFSTLLSLNNTEPYARHSQITETAYLRKVGGEI